MPIKIRKSLFETNSSSTHSITIQERGDFTSIKHDGLITLSGGEFGWEWERYTDPMIKANYCAVYAKQYGNQENEEMLKEGMERQTGAQVEISAQHEEYEKPYYSYIDHQSDSVALKVFESADSLKNFIFGLNSVLFTGNDNSSHPPNFYDEPNTKYKGELSLEGVQDIIKLKNTKNLTKQEIDDLLRPLIEDAECFLNVGRTYSKEFRLSWGRVGGEGENSIDFKNQTVLFVVSKPIYDKKNEFLRDEILEKKYLKFQIKAY